MIRVPMLARLRRSRLTPFFLVALSPALGGWVLAEVHPCTVESPWLADGAFADPIATAGHHHHESGETPADPHPGSHDTCHCLGSCCPAAIGQVPEANCTWTRAVEADRPESLPIPEAPAARGTPSDWLPPATAPPSPDRR